MQQYAGGFLLVRSLGDDYRILLITLFKGEPRAHAPQSTKSPVIHRCISGRARADGGDVTLSRQAVRSPEPGPLSAGPARWVTDHGERRRAGRCQGFSQAGTEISAA